MEELLTEAVRGLDALLGAQLLLGAAVAALVVAAAAWTAHRQWQVVVDWPLLVVAAVSLGVRERAVLPLLAAVAGWWLAVRLDVPEVARPRALLGVVAVTALGLFGTLPETQEAVALLAAVAVVAAAGLAGLVDLARVRGPQLGALLGLLVWVCFAGDGQRGRALLAGLLCVAMLAAVALLLDRWLPPLLGLHVVVTVAASRWVGLAADLGDAALRALPVAAVAAVGLVLVHRTGARTNS